MSVNDFWLLERARAKKAASGSGRLKSAPLKATPSIDGLWSALQDETRRQAKVFTDALGNANALVVTTPPDAIEIRSSDGKELVLRVDRERRTLSEVYSPKPGVLRPGKPSVAFTTGADGEARFNFGGLQGAAGSILRRMVG